MKSSWLARLLSGHWPVIAAILMIGCATTLLAWSTSRDQAERAITMTLENRATALQDTLERRLNVYGELLRGAAGLFAAQDNQVTADEWRAYVSSLHVRDRYPGSIAVGYVRFIDEAKSTSSVTFIEPVTDANRNVFGVDMFADPSRRAAMERARDTAMPQTSQSLVLMRRDISEERGVLYYAPVYASGAPTETLEQRRAAIEGFVYMPVRASDLFAGIVGRELPPNTLLTIDELHPEATTYRIFATPGTENVSWAVQTDISVAGTRWRAALALNSDETMWDDTRSMAILVGGIIMTGALAGFIWVVIRVRARELEYQRQIDVQTAKDELVSLASHQLRTPATGVKQYLGMVLEGYAGKITSQQRDMLQRAFDSNERQIETVGQILHITRLESNRLKANMRQISLSKLVDTVVDEQKSVAQERQHRVRVEHIGRGMFEGDQQYVHMMIENLLGNAIKYTPPKGRISIKTASDDDYVFLRIEDTGVGIASEDFERMYEKFSRLDNPLSIEAGGSGVGLYLLRMIVEEMHHGTVQVESDVGVGTVFTVILPKRQSQSE